MFENLEQRQLLSASLPGGGIVVLSSTVPGDTFLVDLTDPSLLHLQTTLDGTNVNFPLSQVKGIVIRDLSTNGSAMITISPDVTLPVTVLAGDGDDSIFGGEGPTVIDCGDGDDHVISGGGNDSISGGNGADLLIGGSGNDTIDGGDGHSAPFTADDTLWGGYGDDSLYGGAGLGDWLLGGPGNDTLIGGPGDDNIDESPDEGMGDVLSYKDRTATNTFLRISFDYNNGNDGFYNQQGTRIFEMDNIIGLENIEIVWGSEGSDTLDNSNLQGGFAGKVLVGFGGNDVLIGSNVAGSPDTLDGGQGDDSLFGNAGNDVLLGGEGRDILSGDAGNDSLDGGAGDDSVNGGDGDDSLNGGAASYTLASGEIVNSGADVLLGGPGIDTLDYSARTAPIRVTQDELPNDGEMSEGDNVGGIEIILLRRPPTRIPVRPVAR